MIRVTVNGVAYEREVEPRLLLADFLRHDLGLSGTHVGCEQGVCGACTVILNGDSVRACLCFAVQADGGEIETVESLGTVDNLNPLQQAFQEHHALQCGFCTPGILMSLSEFLERNPAPAEVEIRELVSGHLCRCTGYVGILRAISEVIGGAGDKQE